jgi:hypothetical protein
MGSNSIVEFEPVGLAEKGEGRLYDKNLIAIQG